MFRDECHRSGRDHTSRFLGWDQMIVGLATPAPETLGLLPPATNRYGRLGISRVARWSGDSGPLRATRSAVNGDGAQKASMI